MANTDNYFQRQLDRGVQDLNRTQDSMRKALGIGKTAPLGQVKLTGQQKIDYFKSQPDQKKLELWNQMEEAERQEIGRGLTGEKGR